MASLGIKRPFWIAAGALLIIAILLAIFFQSNEFRAERILSRSCRTYAALSSYRCSGITLDQASYNDLSLLATFTMKLARSNFYLVEYEQGSPTFTSNKGAVWSTGVGDYFKNDLGGGKSRRAYPNLCGNLNMITDISGGSTAIVPPMFFRPWQKNKGIFIHIKELLQKRQVWHTWADPEKWTNVGIAEDQDGKVGNVECDVLSAKFQNGRALLWIGKKDFLVHQSREWVKYSDSETADQMLARVLTKGMQAPLPLNEMKRRIDDGRKEAEKTMKPVKVIFADKPVAPKTGVAMLTSMEVNPPLSRVYTQTYRDIVLNPPLTASDFVHTNTNTVFLPALRR